MKVYLKAHDGLRNIGEFKNGVFYATRKRSKHFFEAYKGWGIDAKIFDGLLAKGLTHLVIYESEKKTYYSTDSVTFVEHKKTIDFPPHGKQYVLPEEFWNKSKDRPF